MTTTKFLARGCTFELNTTGSTWVAVEAINNWSHSPQSADADTTTFDENGRQSHLKASRGDQFTVAGLGLEDPETGAKAPGQAAVEAWADLIGPDSIKNFRITTPGGKVIGFAGSATVTRGGGGNNDPSAWSVAIVVSGALTTDGTVPAVPTAVSGSTNLATASLIDFTTSTGSPDLFEAVIYEDGVEVARVASTGNPIYVSGLEDGESYTAKVRAHNATGWSALSTASSAFIVND